MPVYIDISPINRLIVIVARDEIAPGEIAEAIGKLMEANVPTYSKIIDVSGARSELTREQVEQMAGMRRRPEGLKRGALAFVTNPEHKGFPEMFAEITSTDRPIRLFHSLHEARKWLIDGGAHGGAARPGSALGPTLRP